MLHQHKKGSKLSVVGSRYLFSMVLGGINTPLHIIKLSEIVTILTFVASFIYLLGFFGIDFVRFLILQPSNNIWTKNLLKALNRLTSLVLSQFWKFLFMMIFHLLPTTLRWSVLTCKVTKRSLVSRNIQNQNWCGRGEEGEQRRRKRKRRREKRKRNLRKSKMSIIQLILVAISLFNGDFNWTLTDWTYEFIFDSKRVYPFNLKVQGHNLFSTQSIREHQ